MQVRCESIYLCKYILLPWIYKRVYLKYSAPKTRTGTKEEEYDTYDSSGDGSATVTYIPDGDDYDNTITASTSEKAKYNYPTPENPLTLPPRRITTPGSIGSISELLNTTSKLYILSVWPIHLYLMNLYS